MNYTWNIVGCWRRSIDGMIWKVEYKVIGRKGDLKVSMMDQIRFRESDNPTPFASVSEDQIVSWVKSKIGTTRENKIYDFLDKEMASKESAPNSSGTPWGT